MLRSMLRLGIFRTDSHAHGATCDRRGTSAQTTVYHRDITDIHEHACIFDDL